MIMLGPGFTAETPSGDFITEPPELERGTTGLSWFNPIAASACNGVVTENSARVAVSALGVLRVRGSSGGRLGLKGTVCEKRIESFYRGCSI